MNTIFIVTLTVDQEWQDLNAELMEENTVDFGFGSQSSAEESPMNKRSWDRGGGGEGGDGGDGGRRNTSSVSTLWRREEEGEMKEEEVVRNSQDY